MAKAFVFDHDLCNGCYSCQIACKDEHCGYAWLPYAEAQPEIGQFWCRVDEKERGQVPVVRVSYTPVICAHCEDAPCVAVCADGAFTRREDGLLLLDPAKCTGCKKCLEACPAGAIYFNDELNVAQKCTGCAHLLDDGWTVPRCVDNCATGALSFGEEDELDLEGTVCLPGLEGKGAKVYYKNYPKRFVAGCVFDEEHDEALIGAPVRLYSEDNALVAETVTDEFGDWKFDQVEPAIYKIEIMPENFPVQTIKTDVTEKDVYTGDLGLKKSGFLNFFSGYSTPKA